MKRSSSEKHFPLTSGFTLTELLIVIAIISIIAGIAIPSYLSYVVRGKIVEATNNLSSVRALMEQYYQDNRTYLDVSNTIQAPCNPAQLPTLKYFTLTCPVQTATTYTITATGTDSSVTGFSYSITNTNTQTSTVSASWGGGSYACWITKQGSTC